MYMQQARAASAEQKEKAKLEKAETTAKAANAATFQYKTALESGDPDKIAKAEEALLANAVAHGYDGMSRMSAASTHVRNQQDQQWQAEEQERQKLERAANEQFMAKMNGTEDTDAIQAIVDQAPPEMQAVAQQAATRRLQYLEGVETRRAREAENQQIVDVSIEIPTDETILPAALQKQFQSELEQLEKDAESSKVGGTWEPSVRRKLQERRDRLAFKISDAATRNVLNQESEARAVQRDFDKQWQRVATDLPTDAEAKEIKKDLEAAEADNNDWNPFTGSTPTSEEVIAEFRRRQYESLESVRPGGSKAEAPTSNETYTEAQEATIETAVQMYPNKSREEIIAALKAKGKL